MRSEGNKLIVGVAPRKGQRCRCPHCNRKSPVRDCSQSQRRWRTLDLGSTMTCLEYATLRAKRPEHGVVTASVPRAHRASRLARAFEQQVAWPCVHCSRSVVARPMRIDWKSAGPVCKRVCDKLDVCLVQ